MENVRHVLEKHFNASGFVYFSIMAVWTHIYSRAKHFGDFGLSATKIGLLTPSARKTYQSISHFI
jgi:hypothetical protein